MSIAEIDRFVADLKTNDALRVEAVNAQADKSHAKPVDRAAAFAASKGYAFTADELQEHIKATAKAAGKVLTDAELEGVAAGVGGWCHRERPPKCGHGLQPPTDRGHGGH
ncbi:hypothetical protein BH11PSE3_BH11PSE3_11170 [soil metagenome]